MLSKTAHVVLSSDLSHDSEVMFVSAKKAFCFCSSAIVVMGPWPGQRMVAGGNDIRFSRAVFIACL